MRNNKGQIIKHSLDEIWAKVCYQVNTPIYNQVSDQSSTPIYNQLFTNIRTRIERNLHED